MNYFELKPVRGAVPQASCFFCDESIETVIVVDADFATGGPWAGVSSLVERAYLELREQGAAEILERHNYELHMALPRRRSELPLRHGCLTDLAVGAEKTRNFPLD